MSFKQVYPELAKIEHGQVLYACSICKALTFKSTIEAQAHCILENKGRRKDSQWRCEVRLKQLPITGPVNAPVIFLEGD